MPSTSLSASVQAEVPPAVDPLVIGITRPATVLGVSYPLFVASIVATSIAFLASDHLAALALCVPLHMGGYAICRRDVRRFEIVLRRFRRCPPVANRRFWNCSSYEPG